MLRQMPAAKRRYELKKRAEQLEEVRRRIVAAAVELHGEVGPAQTTISEIARRAGVGRLTVYRHFADEEELYRACAQRWVAERPGPDPERWRAIADPSERLDLALRELYGYYRAAAPLLCKVVRDAELVPALRTVLDESLARYVEQMRAVLLEGWSVRGRRRARVRAALGLALAIATWQALTREGLDDEDAAAIAAGAVLAAAT